MSNTIKSKIIRIALKVLSKFTSQIFWQNLYLLSLRQMNYGNGGDFKQSGELFVAKFILQKVAKVPNIVVFDVGAHVGNYTTALNKIFGDKAKIFSFEPAKESFQILLPKVVDLKNVHPFNIGFSDRESTELLYAEWISSGLASLYKRKLDHFGIYMNRMEEVQLSTIDSFCQANNIDKIHFLKLDTEGHEQKILEGALKMINENRIDYIQFEFGGCNIDSKTYFRDFYNYLAQHYRIYRLLENGIKEIPVYKEWNEIFLNVNYLAINRLTMN